MHRPAADGADVGAAQRDPAARAAALIQFETQENFRRRRKTRQIALAITTGFLMAVTLWLVATLFRWGTIS